MKDIAVFNALRKLFNPTEDAWISRKRLKRMRPTRYKPAFSMGFRGNSKSTHLRPGSVPAPTIDQVRKRERKYGQKLHVARGLMFFASDGFRFTPEEARRRQAT